MGEGEEEVMALLEEQRQCPVFRRRHRVTPLVIGSITFAAMQSLNFGFGIGHINNSKDVVMGWLESHGIGVSETGWALVVSMLPIGGMVGALAGGVVTKKMGPRKAQVYNNFTFICGGILLAMARNVPMLCFGRFLIGVGAGVCCAAVPVYAADIAPDHVRGAFGVFHQLFITIGILAAAVLGMRSILSTYDRWPILYGFFILPSVLHLTLMPMCPESPRHLAWNGRLVAARDSLARLRGLLPSDMAITNDINRLRVAPAAGHGTEGDTPFRALCTSPGTLWPLSISVGLQILQQLSGINAIMFYSTDIFFSTGLKSGELATILVALVNFLATVVAVRLVEVAGRRGLLLASFIAMAAFHTLFAIALLHHGNGTWNTVAIAAILGAVISFALGPGPIPWLMAPEILPQNIASAGISLCVFANWFLTAVVGLTFPFLSAELGPNVFFLFGIACVLASVFVAFVVVETKGRSREEIADTFTGRTNTAF